MSINRVYVENIAQLIELVKEDKLTQNASTYLRDRYPIRFVLFDSVSSSTFLKKQYQTPLLLFILCSEI